MEIVEGADVDLSDMAFVDLASVERLLSLRPADGAEPEAEMEAPPALSVTPRARRRDDRRWDLLGTYRRRPRGRPRAYVADPAGSGRQMTGDHERSDR